LRKEDVVQEGVGRGNGVNIGRGRGDDV